MKRLLPLLTFFPAALFSWALCSALAADAPPQTVPLQQYQDVVGALRDQRDTALDGLAAAQVQIADLRRQLAEARKTIPADRSPK